MRPVSPLNLLLCLALSAEAATDTARQAQVASATTSAVNAVDQEIAGQPLEADQTIKDFLRKTDSDMALRGWLAKEQPVGGPRWLDEQTCQVRLEVDGDKLADWLLQQAKNADNSQVDPRALAPLLATLRTRRFVATSTTSASDVIQRSSSDNSTKARGNPFPDQHRGALLAARQNAAERLVAEVGPLEATDGRTVNEIIAADPRLRKELLAYLRTAPVISTDWRDDSQVRIQLGPSKEELAEMIYTAAAAKDSADLDSDDFRNLQALHERMSRKITEITGTANITQNAHTAATVEAVKIPLDPPGWVDQQLDAVGHGYVSGSQLRSDRAAEHDASLKLRRQLISLRLDGAHTILDAASDPHVVEAINQTLEQARPYKSEFNSDGSVSIHEILDLHDFWQALSGNQ